ncbi:hypothetical protein [Halorubrum cibi]|uniref:Uncharacterized protein n=1 Tax=Halorubrum cibi TaxID=413815 RepID=A0A521DUE1_9EURY|nr:hypothetical protein [Halorubrum cibi]SMO75339.1 hypothetical protein SAMN06264867_10843 [Halorubrum cibi]
MDADRAGPDGSDDGSDGTDSESDGSDRPGDSESDGSDRLGDTEERESASPEEELAEHAVDGGWAIDLFRSGRRNALIAWAMVAVLVGVFLESLLGFDLLSMALVAAMVAVVVAPAIAAGDPRAMLPWELLGLALLPVLVRALFGGDLGVFAVYLAIAALALVITVDLHMFTSLRVTHWFAVVLVVMTTMATAAAWTILRWNADRTLGTEFLTTNEALMIEWLYVTLAGLAAGVLFDAYFRRRGLRLRRAIRRVVRK